MVEHTTVTLDEHERERLAEYEHADHDRVADAIEMLMKMVPSPEEVEEKGCTNCGADRPTSGPLNEGHGVIWYERVNADELPEPEQFSAWFCSPECLSEWEKDRQQAIPTDPDKIVVGGHDEFRVEVESGTFYMDEVGTMQAGIDVPGAFTGTAAPSYDYDYVGEPVYVYKGGKVRQSGVIADIIHEENHTTLDLNPDFAVTGMNHPEEERREQYLREWRVGIHTECGERVQVPREDPFPADCPECGEAFSEEDYDEFEASEEYAPVKA